jgi:electron transfer flavoprotein alpha subunit
MSKIMIVAEHDGTTLNESTSKCIACASELPDAEIDLLILASSAGALTEHAKSLDGVTRVMVAEDSANENLLAAVIAPQIVSYANGYSHVFGPSTTFGKDLMPRVAALMGVNQVSDIMRVVGSHTFMRPIYAGNAILTVETPADLPVIATIRTASYRSVGSSNNAPVELLSNTAELPTHTRFIDRKAGASDRPDLQSASTVVSGGRALGSAEQFEIIFNLADKIGAAVGASRAAVDAGYVANELQVGQTGKIIAPDLYIAIGISGAIQHLTGIKDAGTIVAINKDSDAPIFEVADIGLVGDLFAIVPELQDALAS